MTSKATIKIRKVGPGWLWQLLGPTGRAVCTAVEIQKSPRLALEDAAAMVGCCVGNTTPLPACPPVGQSCEYDQLQIWRQS